VSILTQPRKKKAKSGKPDQNEIARALEHYRVLRWFAVISMLAIISWVLIDLFGPIPKYQLNNQPSADLNSREYILQLEALAASRIEPHTHIEALPNGVNFYEAEIAAIKAAQQSVNWEAYIVAKGEIAKRIVDALTERARAGVEVNLNIDALGSLSTPKKFFKELEQAGGHVE
jgi:cardiolipin synthase A/B